MDTREFTELLVDSLKGLFSPESVRKEWDVGKQSADDFDRNKYYAPRVDVAIGPFNIDRNLGDNNRQYNQLIASYKSNLLQRLYEASHLGERREYIDYEDFLRVLNRNPRCFLAIEIEKTGCAKHCLGDIVNASVMGKVGIVIPIGQQKYDTFIKIKRYFHYLQAVGKLKGDFKNVLIIRDQKILSALARAKREMEPNVSFQKQ